MNRYFVFLGWFVAALLIEGMLSRWVVPESFAPKLSVLIVVYLGCYSISTLTALFVFSLGLIVDFTSVLLIGPWAGAFAALYGLLTLISHRLFMESKLVSVVVGFVGVIITDLFYQLLVLGFRPVESRTILLAFTQALITAAIAPLVFWLLRGTEGGRTTTPSRMTVVPNGRSAINS